jgi:predicted O-methyltransferase YrrM
MKDLILADIWGSDYGGSGRGNHNHISDMLQSIHYSGNIEFLDGDSKQTIPTLVDRYNGFFDLILVDGDHSYEGGMIDLENVFPLCKSSGIILFDDINHAAHLYLDKCFDEFTNKYSNQITNISKSYDGHGVGTIVKA